ncbi:MAG: hypothetical protein ABSH11_02420 [Verrucomicrobiota bacterium]|jgi:hypothetical protein
MKTAAIRSEVLVAGAVLLVGLVFASYTHHLWEDYLIAFRASRNLATGYGLVFTPGERLQSFSSPLGVLLPAAFCWLTGNQSDNLVLWLYRLVSLGALAAGVVLLFRVLQTLQLRRVSCWLTVALIGLDAKLVDFSINGMETGLLVFFLALTIHGLAVAGPRQMLRLGVGWAGLMWTRPDSCVYITILGAGTLFFLSGRPAGKSRIEWGKMLFGAGLVCAALYLSWFLWAWWYYGSPFPHSIAAKAANRPPISFADLVIGLVIFPLKLLTPFAFAPRMPFIFLPAYANLGGWFGSYVSLSSILGSLAALVWLVPVLRPQTRLFSLAYFFGNFYLSDVLKYFPPWYLPIVAVFGYLTIGLLFDQALCLSMKFPQLGWNREWFAHLPKILRFSAVGLVAGQLAVTVCVAQQLQVQQSLIENGLRRPIGLWLHNHARTPQDTVMLEPLGYIGYYSGLKMLDYPGLASKEVVEARKRLGPARQNQVYLELKPDWLVLRPVEAQKGTYVDTNGLRNFYELVQVFDASDKINAIRWLPGKPYVQYDKTFLVFHRKPDAGLNPPASGTGE